MLVAGVFRRVLVAAAALLMLVSVTAAFGSSAGASVASGSGNRPAAAVARVPDRAAALAARRALVRRGTSAAAVQALALKAAKRLQAEPRKETAAKKDAAAATVTAQVDETLLTGPDGTITACNGTCSTPGDVAPGEPLSVWEELLVVGGTLGTDYTVKLSWTESCGGSTVKTFGSQTITAPDGSLWAPAPASGTAFDAAASCPGAAASSMPNYDLTLNTAVTGGGTASYAFDANWVSVPPGQFRGCPGSPDSGGASRPQGSCGDPVDTASGIYSDTFTDATLKSPGYPLAVTRSYSSAVTAAGAMGPGWSLPWQAGLSVASSTGDVTFTAENGDTYVYTPNGSGGFTAPLGALSVLAATESSGAVTGYTLTAPDQHVLRFSASGQLTAEADATGRGLAFAYNGSGQVSSITDAASQAVSLSYAGGLLTRVGLPDGLDVSYGYTGGLLTSVTDPDGNATAYGYSPAGLLASIMDPDGNYTVRNTYNSVGQVTSQEDGAGHTTTFAYTTTSGGLPETDVTDPDGGIISEVYGGGMLLAAISPVSSTTTYVYQQFLLPLQVTGPVGGITTRSYDGSGNRTGETDLDGKQQAWAYNGSDDVTSYTSANGEVTSTAYNSMDEPVSVTAPDGGKTTYTYDSAGRLTSQTDPRGNASGATASAYTTTYAYNSAGQLSAKTDPLGRVTSYTYDAMGNLATQTDSLGQVTRYAYDGDGHRLSVTTPGGQVTRYSYDAAGNKISGTDPAGNVTRYAYDARNRLISTTDPLGNVTRYSYDANGNKVSMTDPLGNVTKYAYDASNQLTSVTDPDGGVTAYAYDADGNKTSQTDADGNTTTSAYDPDGNLASTTDPLGGETTYTYDGDGNQVSVTDPLGNATADAYDSDGRLASVTQPGGGVTTYGYDLAGNKTSATKPAGKVGAAFFPVGAVRVLDTRNGTGGTTGPVAAGSTVVLSVAGSNGVPSSGVSAVVLNLTVTAPTAAGDMVAYPDGASLPGVSDVNYASGQTVANMVTVPVGSDGKIDIRVAGGGTAQVLVDLAGYFSDVAAGGSKLDPAGPVRVLDTRSGTGGTTGPVAAGSTVVLSVAGSNGVPSSGVSAVVVNLTATGPTATGNLTAYADGASLPGVSDVNYASGQTVANMVTIPLGSDGKIDIRVEGTGTAQVLADLAGYDYGAPASPGGATTDAYDGDNELVSQKDADGNVTAYAYNAGGQRTSVTDPEGHVTKDAYDPDGRLASVTAPDGGVTAYAYDADGNRISRTDPDGSIWTSAYDADGHLAKTTDPLGKAASYAYDADGNQATKTDANGATTTTAYDADSRPAKITYSDGTPTVTYAYDKDGNQTAVTDGTGTRALAYDKDGRLTSGGGFAYAYDADGDITSRKYPDGTSDAYAYTPDGQVSSTATGSSATLYAYTQTGNLIFTQPPDKVTETRGYDAAGQLTSITDITAGATRDSYGLTRTADGQPSQAAVTQNGTAQPARYYGYDSAGRLTSECRTASGASACSAATANETAYAYDPAGNLTSTETSGATTASSYNADEELTKSVTGTATTSYAYNADGEQTKAGTTTYAYNAAGDLTGAGTAAGNYAYTYDATGNLATTSLNGTKTAGTVWDLNNPLPMAVEDTSAAGATTADYAWNPGGTLASMTTTGGTGYAVSDWLGSVTGLISSAGTQVSSTTYSAYGTPATTGSPVPSVGYAASYTLTGTGLDDMRARDYNPATGEFSGIDPALALTGEPYAYVSGNPVGGTDPSGRDEWGLCGSLLGEGGIMLTGGLCLVATFNIFTGEFQFGGTATAGGGLGMFGAGGAIGLQESNASQISDLGGWFGLVGGSASLGPAISGDAFTGLGACNQQVTGADGQLGVGVDLDPNVFPMWEIHGGATDTWQSTFFSFNVYNAISDTEAGLYDISKWMLG
jgi:RHS repeat-associated protein